MGGGVGGGGFAVATFIRRRERKREEILTQPSLSRAYPEPWEPRRADPPPDRTAEASAILASPSHACRPLCLQQALLPPSLSLPLCPPHPEPPRSTQDRSMVCLQIGLSTLSAILAFVSFHLKKVSPSLVHQAIRCTLRRLRRESLKHSGRLSEVFFFFWFSAAFLFAIPHSGMPRIGFLECRRGSGGSCSVFSDQVFIVARF